MSWYIISFFGFIFTSYIMFFIFSSTPVLTFSIDVVFILAILIAPTPGRWLLIHQRMEIWMLLTLEVPRDFWRSRQPFWMTSYLVQNGSSISPLAKEISSRICLTHCGLLTPYGDIELGHHRTGSTLAQVMACCLMATSHYLIQCWLIISKIQWHSSEGKFDKGCLNHQSLKLPLKFAYKIWFKFPRGWWVNRPGITVPADGPAQWGARPSAGTVMIKCGSRIYTDQQLKGYDQFAHIIMLIASLSSRILMVLNNQKCFKFFKFKSS